MSGDVPLETIRQAIDLAREHSEPIDSPVIARWDHPSGYRAEVRKVGNSTVGHWFPIETIVCEIVISDPDGNYVRPKYRIDMFDAEEVPKVRHIFEDRVRDLIEASRS